MNCTCGHHRQSHHLTLFVGHGYHDTCTACVGDGPCSFHKQAGQCGNWQHKRCPCMDFEEAS